MDGGGLWDGAPSVPTVPQVRARLLGANLGMGSSHRCNGAPGSRPSVPQVRAPVLGANLGMGSLHRCNGAPGSRPGVWAPLVPQVRAPVLGANLGMGSLQRCNGFVPRFWALSWASVRCSAWLPND